MHKKNQKWLLGGLQQVGLGVQNNQEMYKFYREQLGFNIPMFNETGTADIMAPYMGNKSWERHALFAVNLNGGGGMEIWQFTNRIPTPLSHEVSLENTGILSAYIRCKNIHILREKFLVQNIEVSLPNYAPDGSLRCFVRDAGYNWLCLVEQNHGWFIPPKKNANIPHIGGVCGTLIGVSNMDTSINFYSKICGYDSVVYDITDTFSEFSIFPNNQKVRRVLLKRSTPSAGFFSHLLTESFVELVEAKTTKGAHVFRDRFWGDPGFIHLCFDVRGMDTLKAYCKEQKYPFTIDTGKEFSMDDASGRFSYLEDPDGTLIEFVEVYKMPIAKKYGIVLNIKNKPMSTALPKFMLKLLSIRKEK